MSNRLPFWNLLTDKEKDIIERIGSDRKGYWKINNKY